MGICQTNSKIHPTRPVLQNRSHQIPISNWNARSQILSILLLKDDILAAETYLSHMTQKEINGIDENNMNLIMYAIIGNKIRVAERLVDIVDKEVINIRHKKYGVTTLWYACNKRCENLALKILEKTDIELLLQPKEKYYKSDNLNMTIPPLYEAKRNHMIKIINAIEKKISSNIIFHPI